MFLARRYRTIHHPAAGMLIGYSMRMRGGVRWRVSHGCKLEHVRSQQQEKNKGNERWEARKKTKWEEEEEEDGRRKNEKMFIRADESGIDGADKQRSRAQPTEPITLRQTPPQEEQKIILRRKQVPRAGKQARQ